MSDKQEHENDKFDIRNYKYNIYNDKLTIGCNIAIDCGHNGPAK